MQLYGLIRCVKSSETELH